MKRGCNICIFHILPSPDFSFNCHNYYADAPEEQFQARYRRRHFNSSNSGWPKKKKSEPTEKKGKK